METIIKTIQCNLTIGKNDLERKMKQAQKFLEKKEQVRVVLLLKGRQKDHPERGAEFLNNLAKDYLKEYGNCVKPASVKNLSLTFMPITK